LLRLEALPLVLAVCGAIGLGVALVVTPDNESRTLAKRVKTVTVVAETVSGTP
jgi:hypothetical protein